MDHSIKKVKIKSRIIIINSFFLAVACLLFYLVIPYLLNYAPGTINTDFDKQVSAGLYYYQQVLIGAFLLITVVDLFLAFILKDINYYPIYITNKSKYKSKLEYIKKICLTLPNKLLLIFIIIPLTLSVLVLLTQNTYFTSSDFKLMLIIFILSTLTISVINTYLRKEFSNVLINMKNVSNSSVKHTSILRRLLFQILPVISVCIVFTYLLVSSLCEKSNANLLDKYYINQFGSELKISNVTSLDDLLKILSNINLNSENDVLFITDSSFNFLHQTGQISDFFKKYASELSLTNNYRVYDYYGTSGQGIIYPVMLSNGEIYYLGASYIIYSDETVSLIVSALLAIGIICSLILYRFTKELSNEIKIVGDSLESIATNNNNLTGEKLYITSADEIGDLITSYNKIQALTEDHLNQIHNSQETLMESERLASLGQLIGGIAHNLKTPIMSIAGATEGLNDLIKEYDSSIDDPEVNSNDHHEIAGEMKEWTDKIKAHTEYMSDIITAVKGQAVTLSTDESDEFTVEELIKKVNILMKHELKHAIIYLNVSLKVEPSLSLKGDVNSLVQVINNMISNSIQAYNGKAEQNIDIEIHTEDNKLLLSIKDYAGGLPAKVKKKLFKEMITTKGKNGTGLGLYMSYSNIRARFNGDITFETDNIGTKFTIILPL